MESGNGGPSSKGVLIPISESCDAFQNNILTPLKSAYLYEESKQSFKYDSAVLIKNPALEEKYNAFRAKRRETGYSEEDLKESFGFLLFDDINKANALGETGLITGNSTCSTLGDPSKGVYISKYSDCLDLNRWYHGKSGYIVIIRLTKGKAKKISENYTQNFTAPTAGFDCHVSEELTTVSTKTSSFLAFERTQYYMYELLDDGNNEAVQSPSAACPFAIVSFSYKDTKATIVTPQLKSEEKELVRHFFLWSGQLQIGTIFYDVGLRSTGGASIPAELPPVVKIDRAISMFDLRRLLPKTFFETSFSGEVFVDGIYCSLCELVAPEVEQNNPISLLLWDINNKDIALAFPLNNGGFLILLHSSYFLRYDDTGSSALEVLQGMFVFPDSRVIQRDAKFGHIKRAISSEILLVLPALSYAESEVEKKPIDPREELCDVFLQHMQRYATLINPRLATSPSRELSIFPDQYDVPEAHKHLYSSPEWTNRAWQNLTSYLRKPDSFQLPVSKASEILTAGQVDRVEDLDDDVYFCLSSPEEGLGSVIGQSLAVNVETSLDCSAEAQVDSTAASPRVVSDNLLIKSDDMGTKTTSTSADLPTELIVSITSAERTVTDASLISNDAQTKHNDFELSHFPTAGYQKTGGNTIDDETVTAKKVLERPELAKTKRRKLRRGHSKGQRCVSKGCIKTVKILKEDHNLKSQKEYQTKESLDHPQLNKLSNIDTRKMQKRKFDQIDPAESEEKITDPGLQRFEKDILRELEACPLKKKMERWDLKPVISECGRILVPHGLDICEQIKVLRDEAQSRKVETGHEEILANVSMNVYPRVKMEPSNAPETRVDEMEATTSKDGGNCPQNVISHVDPEHSIFKQAVDENDSLPMEPESEENCPKNNGMDTPPLTTVKENPPDTLFPGKCATKSASLLNRLKSVLLRKKKKTGFLVLEEMTDTTENPEPCLKKGKVDSLQGMLQSIAAISSVQDPVGIKEVSTMLSVDPHFAFALGLMPKETLDKIDKSEDLDTQQKQVFSEAQEQTISDKQPQIIQSSLSVFPKRGRIKTLKKHQGISAENVKKKWWLHFQTPACFASEKLKCKEHIRDNAFRMTAKEKSNSRCSPTDALTLLADLALSARYGQGSPQPYEALERNPETSLKKCDLTRDVTHSEQESFLHALLRQPAVKPIQAPQCPLPSNVVESSELIGLISKEHAYSYPPSSSLLLDLSGTPYQVFPLSGSTRLLHRHQTINCDGIKSLHPSVNQEDKSEHSDRTSKYLIKHLVHRRKFRLSRTFVNKDGSVQVTKHWKENYDFTLDSKFTTDSKFRTICRALHGPWNISIQDTSKEIRLIFHMWIGLFYSRSTPRFFDFSSNHCSKETDSLGIPSGMLSTPAHSDLKGNSFAPCSNVTDTAHTLTSNALDLSKKDNSIVDHGSEILDLSVRNCSAESITSDPPVNEKESSASGEQEEGGETPNALKTVTALQEASLFQCNRNSMYSTEIISEANDVRSTFENKRTLQTSGCTDHNNVPSFKDGGTLLYVQEEMRSVSYQSKKTASTIGHVLRGCENEKMDMKNGLEVSESMEKCPFDKDVDSKKKSENVVHKTELYKIEFKHVENCEEKEKPDQEGSMELSPQGNNAGYSKDVETCQQKGQQAQEESRELSSKISNTGESTYVENWEEKEKTVQEDCKELSPKISYTGNDTTIEESSKVHNGNLFEDEKHLSVKEPKAKAENSKEDMECCAVHEDILIRDLSKGNGHDVKDCSISDLGADGDLNYQSFPMMCHCPDTVKDCNYQASLEEQPPQAEKGNACHNLHVRKLCATGSAMTDHILSEEELIDNDPAVVENIKNVGLADLHDEISQRDGPDSIKKPTQEDSKEDTCHDLQFLNCKSKLFSNGGTLTEENYVSEQVPHASTEKEPSYNESVEENSRSHACLDDKIQTSNQTGSPNLNSGVKDWDTHLDEGEQNVEMTTRKETFCDQSHSTQSDAVTMFETDWELTKETNIKSDQTNKGSEKIHNHIVIPFIGIDTSGEDVVQQQSSGKVEEVQVQKRPPFISETAYPVSAPPTEEWGASHIRNADLSACQLPSFLDSGKIDLQHVSGSESDERCPTPTMDEEPYHYLTSYDSSSSSSSSSSSNISFKTCKTQKCFSKSLELIDNEILVEQKQKSTVNSDPNPHHHLHPDLELRTQKVLQSVNEYHTDRSSQIKTIYMKHYYDQTDKLQAMFKPNIGKDGHQTTSQTNLNHELHSYSQRPVMAVKPSKSDEIQANSLSEKILIEKSVISNVSENKMAEPHIDLNTTLPSKFLKREREILQENTSKHNDEQEASEYSTRSRGVSNLSNTNKSNSDKARYVPLDPNYRSRNISKFKKISSSLPSQSFEFLKTSSKHDGNQSFLVEDVGKTTKKSNETGQKYCSESSTSAVDYREDCIIDDDLVPGPQSTLTCTIFNTDTKKRESLLEQLSKRCLQDDLTQASIEQECLIFSEKMKELLKRSKRGPIHQLDACDELNLSPSSLVTVHFSTLEEQDNAVDHFDALSLVVPKIRVVMSDRKDLAETAEEENTLLPQKVSEETGNLMKHAGISGVTADCARQYTAMMNDVCTAKKVLSRPKLFKMDKGYSKPELSNLFDFCDQMKRETDYSFQSNMNSVVRRSCKTKYRFYLLVTSDDPFFEETKAQLEAEGHTAVQPSEFFLGEDSSTLLIILRNEDIAEHICEVPHLLKLKKSPGVRFAGIDEPDDVVNLTHQEVFTRGGFIMFNRTATESLSLCNMKTMTKILQELNTTGKWKWIWHYRDSRQLKENARLSAEAKEKNLFINWCQEIGLLEVLPYHECDLLSRDQPDYLTCLVHLQVQNISARYPVFITDTTTDRSFGTNGIVTLTLSSILTCSPSESFTV